jgi:hypothetical protein
MFRTKTMNQMMMSTAQEKWEFPIPMEMMLPWKIKTTKREIFKKYFH